MTLLAGITILIPTYNRPELLYECLSSIRKAELGSRVQVIISDNASPQPLSNEIDIKQVFKCEYYLQEENRGAIANLDFLFKACETRFAFIITDDDRLYDSQSVVNIIEATSLMMRTGAGYAYSPLPTFGPDMDGLPNIVRRDYVGNTYVNQQDVLSIRRCATSSWGLSRQIWDMQKFDWRVWGNLAASNNGYAMVGPCLCTGLQNGILFYDKNVICHRNGNKVFWDDLGADRLIRRVKLEADMAIAQLSALHTIKLEKHVYDIAFGEIGYEMWADLIFNYDEGLVALINQMGKTKAFQVIRQIFPACFTSDNFVDHVISSLRSAIGDETGMQILQDFKKT